MLQRQNGKFCYFPHTRQEIIDILSAYKYSLNPTAISNGYRTLDGLNAHNYNSNDVDREIKLLSSKLESRFGIFEHDIPPYDVKDCGSVDEQKMLGETELKQFIKDNTDFLDREVFVVEGTIDDTIYNKGTISLFVDKQTGILLKYEYKTDVSIVTMEMEQIAIDQDDQDDFYLEYIKNKKN